MFATTMGGWGINIIKDNIFVIQFNTTKLNCLYAHFSKLYS